MPNITDNVEFSFICREIRCKWADVNGDKTSLTKCQEILNTALPGLKGEGDVKNEVQRIVCGGCLDFKIITKVNAEVWGAFEASGFGGEAAILEALGATDNVSSVETQTYTIATM